MSFYKELIRHQDKLYLLFDKVKEKHVKPEKINDLKLLWECDTVLKQKNPVGDVYLLVFNIFLISFKHVLVYFTSFLFACLSKGLVE